MKKGPNQALQHNARPGPAILDGAFPPDLALSFEKSACALVRAWLTSNVRQIMDTDDLTPMAYKTLSLAHEACEPMRAEIGAAASGYHTEDEYLVGMLKFFEEVLDAPQDYLERWDLASDVATKAFSRAVKRAYAHANSTLKTPRSERGKPPFER